MGENYNARRREQRKLRAEQEPILCAQCGTLFPKYRARTLTCSPECRKARIRGSSGPLLTICVNPECGQSFTPTRADTRACSASCRDRAKYLRKRDNPEFRAKRNAATAQHYWANRDDRLAAGARWREQNRERHRQVSRAWAERNKYSSPRSWRADNPDKHAARQRRRNARLRELTPIPVRHEDVVAKVAYWGGKCWLCMAPSQAVDHVKPIAHGGLNIVANMRPICVSCNSKKRDRWFGPSKLSLLLRE